MLWVHGVGSAVIGLDVVCVIGGGVIFGCSEMVHVVGCGTSGTGGIVSFGGRIGIVVWCMQCCSVISSEFHGGSIGVRCSCVVFCWCDGVSYRSSNSISNGWCIESDVCGITLLRLYVCSNLVVLG